MHSYIIDLISEIAVINKLQEKFLRASLEMLSGDDLQDLQAYIHYCIEAGYDLRYLAYCYDLIVKDTVREQIFFKRHKKYRFSRFAEVASSVYFNDDYMCRYMLGLALTTFLWPNHLVIRRFFLKTIPKHNYGNYLEVGPGHGFYMLTAMRHSSFSQFIGIDISPTSVELTKSILGCGCFGEFTNYEIIEKNFLSCNLETKFDAVVMGEVLEHVENPIAFLKKIYSITNHDPYIFITTCINSPAIDHIYLYRSAEKIEEQVDSVGLYIKEKLLTPYVNTTLEESQHLELPINVALVLGKTHE